MKVKTKKTCNAMKPDASIEGPRSPFRIGVVTDFIWSPRYTHAHVWMHNIKKSTREDETNATLVDFCTYMEAKGQLIMQQHCLEQR